MILQECEEPSIRSMDHTSPVSNQAAASHQSPQAVPEGPHGILIDEAPARGHSPQKFQQERQLVPSHGTDDRPQKGNTQDGDVQHAGQVPEMASSQHEEIPRPPSQPQLIQQARGMVLDCSAPTPSGNPICPSLNLHLFTQVASLQPSCAAQSQIGACADSASHLASRAEPPAKAAGLPVVSTDELRLRDGASVSAETAIAAGALTCIEETAREEGARVALSTVGQLAAEEQLGLCLRLDDTQIEAEPGAYEQAAMCSLDAGATVIPDTMEPCSSSKETPKSKQQAVHKEQPSKPAADQQGGLPAAAAGEGRVAAAPGEAGKQHQDVQLQHGFTVAPGDAQQPARRRASLCHLTASVQYLDHEKCGLLSGLVLLCPRIIMRSAMCILLWVA